VRPPRPAAGAPPGAAPSPRVTIISLAAALAWAVSLPALLERTATRHGGPPGAAEALLWSSVPHTAAAAAFLALMLLRQGRWYRPWQSTLLIALSVLYLAGSVALVVAVQAGAGPSAR
jgi:hypothetical protein